MLHDLIIIGAGPGGIALAAEASASGIDPSQILILEKGPDSIRAAFARAGEPKRLLELEGGHYSVYRGSGGRSQSRGGGLVHEASRAKLMGCYSDAFVQFVRTNDKR